MTDSAPMRIEIHPQPSDREMAAITAAVLTITPKRPEPDAKPLANAWREAGKRESLRGEHRE